MCENSQVRNESLVKVGEGAILWYEDMHRKLLPLDSNTVLRDISKPEQNISWIPNLETVSLGDLSIPEKQQEPI